VDAPAGKIRLEEGNFFGEMALLTRDRRSATVTAIKSTDLLVLDCDDFHRFIDRNPEIGAQVRAVAQGRTAGRVARAG
jgi:CRP-like cAMP-binding protein